MRSHWKRTAVFFTAVAMMLASGAATAVADGGDFNGDGKDDIAYRVGSNIYTLPSTGSSFGFGGLWRSGMGASGWVGVGDFNGDNKDDIAYKVGSNIHVLTSNGLSFAYTGNWRSGMNSFNWAGPGDLGEGTRRGDFSGDGQDDLVWYDTASQGAYVMTSNGNGFDWQGQWRSGLGTPGWAGTGDFPTVKRQYPTSWQYGGANHAVDTDDEAAALGAALASSGDALALWNGLTATDKREMMLARDPSYGGWASRIDLVAPSAPTQLKLEEYAPDVQRGFVSWRDGVDPEVSPGVPGSGVDEAVGQARIGYLVNGAWSFGPWTDTDLGGVDVVGGPGVSVRVEARSRDAAGRFSAVTAATFTLPPSALELRVVPLFAAGGALACVEFCPWVVGGGVLAVGATATAVFAIDYAANNSFSWDLKRLGSDGAIDLTGPRFSSANQKTNHNDYVKEGKRKRGTLRGKLKSLPEGHPDRVTAGESAHHVVGFAKAAAKAQEVLRKCGFDLNGFENGVGVETKTHRSMHTKAYWEAINRILAPFDPDDDKFPCAAWQGPDSAGNYRLWKALQDLKDQIKQGKIPRDYT